MDGRFEQALAERKAKGLLRHLRGIAPSRRGYVMRDGRELLDLSSNDLRVNDGGKHIAGVIKDHVSAQRFFLIPF